MDDQVVGVGAATGAAGVLGGVLIGAKVLFPALANWLNATAEAKRGQASAPEDLDAAILRVLRSTDGQAAIAEAVEAKSQREELDALKRQLAQAIKLNEAVERLDGMERRLGSLLEHGDHDAP